jgi:cytochrome c peroxidase
MTAAALAQGRGPRGRPQPGGNLLLPFDTSRDGTISKKELAAAFLFLDADKSGKIERSEIAGPASGAFGALDRNGDGVLDRDELKRAAQRMPKLPQPRARLPDPDGPLPVVAIPKANPSTAEKVLLGKMLFWEQQISSSKTVACGTCHAPNHGGADARLGRHPGPDGKSGTPDDVFGSPGVASLDRRKQPVDAEAPVQVTPRSSPAFFGSLHAPEMFWDGRAGGRFRDPLGGGVLIASGGALESQALMPILNRVEMSHAGRTWHQVTSDLSRVIPMRRAKRLPRDVLAALATGPTYPKLFARAFGDGEITPKRIAFAIASYERTLLPNRTPYDRYVAGDATAMTANQVRGWRAFRQSACAVCHPPPFFSDHTFRNIGVRPIAEDIGRAEVTRRKGDRGKFKVPSLRNVGLKRRFMHNGRFANLRDVLDHYSGRGSRFSEDIDPLVARRISMGGDRRALTDFLANALTDPRAAKETAPFDHPSLGE